MSSFGRTVGWIAVAGIIGAIYSGFTDAERDDSGSIVDSGNLSVFKLKVGDCLSEDFGDQTKVADTTAVPCAEPHFYEVYYSSAVSYQDRPSDMPDKANDICDSQFLSHYGIVSEDTDYTFSSLFPTVESWANGDRDVSCLISKYDKSLIMEYIG